MASSSSHQHGHDDQQHHHPHPADPLDPMWKSLTAVLFEIGEREMTKWPEVCEAFNDHDKRWPFMLGWLRHAVQKATEKRRGDATGILLSTGKLVTEADVPGPVQPLFQLLLRAQVSGSDADTDFAVRQCAKLPKFRMLMQETADILQSMYSPKPPLTMDKIWASFFSCTFRVAEEAMGRGELAKDDVAMQEPWLYLGLTSCTSLDLVLRSPPTGPFRLAFGETDVDEREMPPAGREIFAAFLQLRGIFAEAHLTQEQIVGLRKRVLWGDREDPPEDLNVTAPTTPAIQRIMALLQSISIRASQETEYKKHFDEMLMLVAAVA